MNHSSMHKLGTFLIATGANLVPCEIDFRNNNNNSKLFSNITKKKQKSIRER